MDILNPDLVWIDGICYRCRYLDKSFKQQINSPTINVDKPDLYDDDEDDNGESDDEIIYTELNSGRIKTTISVPQCFLGYLIGTKGATKKRIENETKTDIKIPARGQSGEIVVSGYDRKSVSSAIRRIKLIVIGSRQKQSITHFISIPMNSNEIKANFKNFKDEILESQFGKSINPDIFVEPEKLHITLVTMFLADEEERNTAKNILEENKSWIIKEHFANLENATINLKGVSYMNDDPKSVHVLYANIIYDDLKINELVLTLRDVYEKTGFLSRNKNIVNLHVTLMNTVNIINDNNEAQNDNKKYSKRIAFDGSQILEKYKDYDFGKQIIKEIHLSQKGTVNSDGYYKSTHIVSL